MNKLFLILLVLGCSSMRCIQAQPANENLTEFIQNKIEQIVAKEKLPGVFVGILNSGQQHYFNAGFGVPDKKLSFDSSMIFEIGSITKTFTAYVLMAVLMENNISEKTAIYNYLPDSIKQNKSLDNISFLNLMNHTSGLARLPENMKLDSKMPYDNYTAADLFEYLKTADINPDGEYRYSNLGAGLGGVLASQISGKTYKELVKQHISLPFMNATGTEPDNGNKSQGYFTGTEKIEFWNMDVLAPAGGLTYSTEQMLGYLQNMAFPKTDQAKNILEKLTQETVVVNKQVGIGLGWHIFKGLSEEPVYWHNGGTYGFSTFCAFSKNKSKAVVVVINQYNKNSSCDQLGGSIIKKILGD